MPKSTKRMIKGWAVMRLRDFELGDIFFTSKKKAKDSILSLAWHANILITKEALKSFMKKHKIIPVSISYKVSLPAKKK